MVEMLMRHPSGGIRSSVGLCESFVHKRSQLDI